MNKKIIRNIFITCFLLLLTGCIRKNIQRIYISQISDNKFDLVPPDNSITPISIQFKNMGIGDKEPPTLIKISQNFIEITILEDFKEIVTCEVPVEDTSFKEILSNIEPKLFNGAYNITNRFLRDGEIIEIYSKSCYYSIYVMGLNEMPKEYNHLKLLISNSRKLLEIRKSYKIINREPFKF